MAKIKGNRNIWIVIGIILSFVVISLIYFSPQLEGKKLVASDNMTFQGVSKEIRDFRKETGKEALWTDSMFGGMPAYLVSTEYPGDLLAKVQNFFHSIIHRPASLVVLSFLLFFVMCRLLGFNALISMAGAFMYGFSTFFFVLISTGHFTKVHALNYMALVVGGIIFAYRKKPLLGSLITAFGLSWMLSANHPQMSYYTGLMVLIIVITYFIVAVREKNLPSFLKTSGLLVIALILAVGTYFSQLYTTYEYGKYSTRGKSELTGDQNNQTSGLDKDYILDYSYDLGEAMTAFIPRFKGGGMDEPLGENSEVYQFFEKNQGKAAAKRVASGLPLYWGSQPISSAPFYYGAVLCFLFVFGLFVVKGKDKWWIVAVVVLSFLLSLGKNFSVLSNFMIDYFPGYNKFRDVKNIIVIQQFAMALLGVMAVRELYLGQYDKTAILKKLKYSWFILGGLSLAFVIMPSVAGNFSGNADAQLTSAGWPAQLMQALVDDRRMVLRNDAFKAFIFVSLAAGVIWLYILKKIKAGYALALWVLLVLVDLWPVDKKYLNDNNFESKSEAAAPFKASVANQEILKDKDPDFRVLNLTVNPFSDASTSYFHKSIGGYHGAKMERYQELIDHQISPEIQKLIAGFKNPASIDSVMKTLPVINVLNTRYFIYNRESAPLRNNYALGAAWFVDDMEVVQDADAEMDALSGFDPSQKAIIDQRFSDQLKNVSFGGAHESSIELVEYEPNYLKYKAKVGSGEPVVVFSEIWYPEGWKAFIDGKETDYFRTDYVLRGMSVPAGEHVIEFRFEPSSYKTGNNIAMASSLILLLVTAGVVFVELKKKKLPVNEEKKENKV